MVELSNIRCPACEGALVPTELHCAACDVSIRGRFAPNEFASLGADDLHFLRIFVVCEGSIRDMESALGVSYPTIKARLARLKEELTVRAEGRGKAAKVGAVQQNPTAEVLRDLEAGRVTFEQAMARIRQIQKGEAS